MSLFSSALWKLESSLLSTLRHQNIAFCQQSLVKYSSWAPTSNKAPKRYPTITPMRTAAVVFVGVSCGILVFGGNLQRYFSAPPKAVVKPMDCSSYVLKEAPPEPEKLAASYLNPNDKTGLKITLYQYMTCPFCCKARAFLDFYGFSYDIVEVNSVTRAQTKWTKYRKVPFLVIQEESTGNVYHLKDSSLIISSLSSYLSNSNTLKGILDGYPISEEEDQNKKKKEVITNKYCIMYQQLPEDKTTSEIMNEREWRQWVDNVYVHVLSPNVYRTFSEAKQAFSWFAKAGKWEDLFPKWELSLVHYVGSTAMYLIAKRLKKRHNIRDDVRIELYETSNHWLKSIKKKNTKFMGGDVPNLSDISVYGVLTAIEGCDAFEDLLQNTDIGQWFDDMKHATRNKLGSHHVSQNRS